MAASSYALQCGEHRQLRLGHAFGEFRTVAPQHRHELAHRTPFAGAAGHSARRGGKFCARPLLDRAEQPPGVLAVGRFLVEGSSRRALDALLELLERGVHHHALGLALEQAEHGNGQVDGERVGDVVCPRPSGRSSYEPFWARIIWPVQSSHSTRVSSVQT